MRTQSGRIHAARWVCCLIIASGAGVESLAGQPTLIVSERSGYYTGYGSPQWPEMTAALDAQFDSITVVSNIENLNELLAHDALWVDQRLDRSLSATELNNIDAFADTGRRVVLIGENNNWSSWNNQLMSVVGGAIDHTFTGITTAVGNHPLVDGVSEVDVISGSAAAGGEVQLFAENFATIWGARSNVLTILDSNLLGHDQSGRNFWALADNSIFGTNVAEWISDSGGPVLTVQGSCPGQMTFSVSGATPGGNVAFVYAFGAGNQAIPPGRPCAGTVLGLDQSAQLGATANANANGEASTSSSVPAAACGRVVVQAIDLDSCATTNVEGL